MPFMTSDQKDEAISQVRQRFKKCPNDCTVTGGSVEVGDLVGLPLVERGVPSGVVLGGQFMPVIPVVCKNCGCVTWFSAAGLVDLDE